jgi:predicted nucleic acid-binding protein
MTAALFGDTFYWIALADFNDGAHRRAVALTFERADSTIVTTDEVLAEYLTFFATAPEQVRRKAVTNAQRILDNRGVRVVPQSRQSFLSGMALYGARPDKGYSLTDCISMQTMRREGADRGANRRSPLRAGRVSRAFSGVMKQAERGGQLLRSGIKFYSRV